MGCGKSRDKAKTEEGQELLYTFGAQTRGFKCKILVSPISKVRLALLKTQCDLLIKQKNSVRHDGPLL